MCARTSVQTDLLANGGETTGLAALVDGVADPVDACIAADLGQDMRYEFKKNAEGHTALWLGSTRMTS